MGFAHTGSIPVVRTTGQEKSPAGEELGLVPDKQERAKWFTRGTDATREEWHRWNNNAPRYSVPIRLSAWLTDRYAGPCSRSTAPTPDVLQLRGAAMQLAAAQTGSAKRPSGDEWHDGSRGPLTSRAAALPVLAASGAVRVSASAAVGVCALRLFAQPEATQSLP